jgi:hypothetical protein
LVMIAPITGELIHPYIRRLGFVGW